ncbi:EamA family transporter [Tessaracoccus sp. G1721]
MNTAMSTSSGPAGSARDVGTSPDPSRIPGRRGVMTVLVGAASNQVGAGLGAQAFEAVGPAGVVAGRQVVAAALLLPLARPRIRELTWAQWWPSLLLALVFASMNLSLYTAIDRIGLALAITLEFVGPLVVALLTSRTRSHRITAVVAALGVYVLILPGPASDLWGLVLGLLAGACWAGYIVLNRVVGARLPGLQAPALASALCAVGYLPVVIIVAVNGGWDPATVGRVLVTGLLSSVVPYAADLIALRTVPPRVFALLSSAQPALAAVAGLVLLGQALALHELVGIAIIIATNVLAVSAAPPRRSERGHRKLESSSGPGCAPVTRLRAAATTADRSSP